MDAERVSARLEQLSNAGSARARGKQLNTLRGIRGVPDGEIARLLAGLWSNDRPKFPRDLDALRTLFGAAYEDGIVAIGLCAALVPDAPDDALDLGLEWLERLDDTGTADALGVLVLGPAALATSSLSELRLATRGHGRPEVRRAGIIAALAWLPEPVTGPGAAALRARVGTKQVQFVDAPASAAVSDQADAFLRDPHPAVQKALRRVLRAWGDADPAALVRWGDSIRGGLPSLLGDEVKRARRRAERATTEEG